MRALALRSSGTARPGVIDELGEGRSPRERGSPLDAEAGVTGRFVQNCTLSRKLNKISGFHKRSFAHGLPFERQILGIFLSKPSFRIDSKGTGHLKDPLACDFGQIVW
jgi:hypothetical protein